MSKRFYNIIFILIVFTGLIDLYVYLGISALVQNLTSSFRITTAVIFWSITLLFILLFLLSFRIDFQRRNPSDQTSLFNLAGLYFLIYFPKIVFVLFRGIEDLIWLAGEITGFGVQWISGKSMASLRFRFISQTGLIFSVIPFLAILTGIMGRFNYKVRDVLVTSYKLPPGLKGLKIIQISDIHLGSYSNKQKKVLKAIDRINAAGPDLVLFTGDLVNNYSDEATGWEEIFSSIHAKYGKYSILGNHDYGAYWNWPTGEAKKENMKMLYRIHEKMGFRLLTNEWEILNINGASLALIGVENWGRPPFPQYGDLSKSMKELPPVDFKILLSHDPTHWDEEVLEKTDIPFTLSGHTHAMQFGIKIGKFKWSPSKYIYDRYWGLYQENGQALYVTCGMGYIGFPGRVGHRPEIPLITLEHTDHGD